MQLQTTDTGYIVSAVAEDVEVSADAIRFLTASGWEVVALPATLDAARAKAKRKKGRIVVEVNLLPEAVPLPPVAPAPQGYPLPSVTPSPSVTHSPPVGVVPM